MRWMAALANADLGVTLDKCATLVKQALPNMPDKLERVFKPAPKRLPRHPAPASGRCLPSH